MKTKINQKYSSDDHSNNSHNSHNHTFSEITQIEVKDEVVIEGKFQNLQMIEQASENKPGRAKVIAVVGGWNKNNKYITDSLLEELPNAIMNKPKLFIDHDFWGFQPRSSKEWAATFEKVWKEGNQIVGEITFTENPNTKWLHSEAKKDASQVQLSIHIYAMGEEYEEKETNRKGHKLTKLMAYESTDFVNYAAAGGGIVQVYNSMNPASFSDTVEAENKIITEVKNEQNDGEKQMNLNVLLSSHPDLVKEVQKLAIEEFKASVEQTKVKEENEAMKTQLSTAQTSISNFETKTKQLETELTETKTQLSEAKLKLDEIEVAQKMSEFKFSVETELKASELPETAITDRFREELYKKPSIEEVKLSIEDRKKTLEEYSVSLGIPKQKNEPKIEAEEKHEVKFSEEDFIKSFKS